jgi:hypothetical protein
LLRCREPKRSCHGQSVANPLVNRTWLRQAGYQQR